MKTKTPLRKNSLIPLRVRFRYLVAALFFRVFVQTVPAFAQPTNAVHTDPLFLYEFTLVDAPFNAQVGSPWKNPSMQQSLNVSRSLYQGIHAGLQQFLSPHAQGFWRPVLSKMGMIAADFSLTILPGFSTWLHEEWHRAVMSQHGVSSYNEILDWPSPKDAWAGTNVSHETDEELSRMKEASNSDFVRLQAAGWEAKWELNHQLRKDAFFSHTQTWNTGLLWLNLLSNTLYLWSCVSGSVDRDIEQENQSAGTDISSRDFTGPDCTGWTYDLHRPNEPYAARGVHASGVGIDRYVKKSDLTGAERKFLRQQSNMSFLNYLDPMLFDVTSFPPHPHFSSALFRWNAHLQHTLTSFGGDTALGVFVATHNFRSSSLFHLYKNRATLFPGFEFEVPEQHIAHYPAWEFSPKIMLWSQPKSLEFDTTQSQVGGLVSLRIGYVLHPSFRPFVEEAIKSQGWVAGVVNQQQSWALRAGFSGHF